VLHRDPTLLDIASGVLKGPLLILVLIVNGAVYGLQAGVEIFAGSWIGPDMILVIEAATQVLSLAVIAGTIAYHLYNYYVKDEEDIRQEQVAEALEYFVEEQEQKDTELEITDEGKMKILYRLQELDINDLPVERIKEIIDDIQQK
jgi:hypothetical protein